MKNPLEEVKRLDRPLREIEVPAKKKEEKPDLRVLTASCRREGRLTPQEIRVRREKITLQLLVKAIIKDTLHERMPVRHVWWPDPMKPWNYELRDGNPPADQDRPPHLRRQDLHIDPMPGGVISWDHINKIRLAVQQHKGRPNAQRNMTTTAKAVQDLLDLRKETIILPHG